MTADQMPDELYVFTSQKGERITYHASTDSDTCGTKYTRAAEAQEQKVEEQFGDDDMPTMSPQQCVDELSKSAKKKIGYDLVEYHMDSTVVYNIEWYLQNAKPTPEPHGAEIAEAVRYFTQERIDLLNRVGFSGAVPFLETLIQSATRQPVETKPVEQEEFIEKTGYVDIYDKIIASGFIITRKD